MMPMLVLSALLTLLPLVGVALIFYQDAAITVDNLFISLMLLAISGVFALNLTIEMKRLRARRKQPESKPKADAATATQTPTRSLGAAAVPVRSAVTVGRQRGIVRDVEFFESAVGVPNKSIVALQLNGANSTRMFVFEGDLRQALPAGKKVEFTYRDTGHALDLQEVNYV